MGLVLEEREGVKKRHFPGLRRRFARLLFRLRVNWNMINVIRCTFMHYSSLLLLVLMIKRIGGGAQVEVILGRNVPQPLRNPPVAADGIVRHAKEVLQKNTWRKPVHSL